MSLTYRAPGIYIKEVANPNSVSTSGAFNTTAIVAPASSTIPITNIVQTKGSGSTDTIVDTNGTAYAAGVVNSVTAIGDLPGFENYTVTTDYTIADNVITWVSSNKPAEGAQYYVSITRNKVAADYLPIRFYSVDDCRTQYGYELVNGVVNPMTMLSMLEMEGRDGNGSILCTQTTDGMTQSFLDAIDKLETEDVDTLICSGVTNSTVRNYAIQHCTKMSSESNKHERTMFCAPETLTASIATINALSAAIANDRVTMITPPQVNVTAYDYGTGESVTTALSSIYAGANISGMESSADFDVATPLLNKQISTKITIDPDYDYIRAEKLSLGAGNNLILERNVLTEAVTIFDALTTDGTSAETQERSIRRIKDKVRKEVRFALEKRYIGQKNLLSVKSSIEMTTSALLQNFIDAQILTGKRNITCKQGTDPRQLILTFQIQPVWAVKWVDVSFSIENVTAA